MAIFRFKSVVINPLKWSGNHRTNQNIFILFSRTAKIEFALQFSSAPRTYCKINALALWKRIAKTFTHNSNHNSLAIYFFPLDNHFFWKASNIQVQFMCESANQVQISIRFLCRDQNIFLLVFIRITKWWRRILQINRVYAIQSLTHFNSLLFHSFSCCCFLFSSFVMGPMLVYGVAFENIFHILHCEIADHDKSNTQSNVICLFEFHSCNKNKQRKTEREREGEGGGAVRDNEKVPLSVSFS